MVHYNKLFSISCYFPSPLSQSLPCWNFMNILFLIWFAAFCWPRRILCILLSWSPQVFLQMGKRTIYMHIDKHLVEKSLLVVWFNQKAYIILTLYVRRSMLILQFSAVQKRKEKSMLILHPLSDCFLILKLQHLFLFSHFELSDKFFIRT